MSAHAWQQRLKWTVYALLFLDFALYVYQDWDSAAYMLGTHATFLDWARAYVTSVDLAAWLVLILLFELETYVLADRDWTGATKWLVHGIRLLCYACILNTSFTDAMALRDFQRPNSLPAATNLCDYTNGNWSFLRNRGYTSLDDGNCTDIGTGPDYYAIGDADVITDRAGLREGLVLAWTDLIENVAWLLVVLANELVVRLEGRSGVLTLLERSKATLYVLIVGVALYWGSKGQLLYLWDELLWVCGFLAIEMNILGGRSGSQAGSDQSALSAST